MNYKHLFGPVFSRRLGLSLGIDLTPYKVCNLNCVYCESGKTTTHISERKEYIPFDEIISELDEYLSSSPALNYLTFSGAGEPTLNSRLGDIIDYLKTKYSHYKIALITNSVLFQNPLVRLEVLKVDLVLPSLDSVTEDVFKKINRPCKDIKIEQVIEGLIEFRKIYKGQIWLEIFLIPGINDTDNELKRMKEKLFLINPDIIQLNTLDRPGTEKWVEQTDPLKLEKIKDYFQPLKTEIISSNYRQYNITRIKTENRFSIISTLKRRPCTADELSAIIKSDTKETIVLLDELIKERKIICSNQNNRIYYTVL